MKKIKKIITERFIKSLPLEKEELILNKVDKFLNELEDSNFDIRSMPNGYSIRRIKGSNIFKFRVNKGERVLFVFSSDSPLIRSEFKEDNYIIILDYCSHDDQILIGKNIDFKNLNTDEYIVGNEIYNEELLDLSIDNEYENYIYNPNETISRIVSDSKLVELSNKSSIYYLNDEQNECINDNLNPMLLFGSAGSGKTTVGVNKLFNLYKNNSINIGYFTYSKYLKSETQLLFNQMKEEYRFESKDSNIDFYDINNYLINNTSASSFVKFEEFKDWFFKTVSRNKEIVLLNLDCQEVYKEIRGIIKGFFGVNWINDISLDIKDINETTLLFLKSNSLIEMHDDGFKLIRSIDDIKKVARSCDIENEITKDILTIKSLINNKISNKKMLDREEYLNLPESFSIYDINKKNTIYNIALKYQEYLDLNNKLDENDLSRKLLTLIDKNKVSTYDFLFIDEVQDLTEVQIYTLYNLIKTPKNLFLSGDYNQTINPTFFNTTRIESLYMISFNMKFYRRNLSLNYRSSKDIVDLSNKLTSLRKDKLSTDKRNDYFENSIKGFTNEPFLLKDKSNNRLDILKSALERHYTSIIVCDDEDKLKLELELGVKDRIFTVAEMKGIEKDYIICYNIISKYKKYWSEIFGLESKKDNLNKYRYYFNLLYVAITRAKDNICLFEKDINSELEEYLKDHITYIDEFNLDSLKLGKTSSSEDFFKEAAYYESKLKYDKAISLYKKANTIKSNECIKRCEGYLELEKGNYKEAGDLFYDIKEYNLAYNSYKMGLCKIDMIHALIKQNKDYDYIVLELKNINTTISDIIKELNNSDKSEELLNEICGLYIDKIKKSNYNKTIEKITENIKNILN